MPPITARSMASVPATSALERVQAREVAALLVVIHAVAVDVAVRHLDPHVVGADAGNAAIVQLACQHRDTQLGGAFGPAGGRYGLVMHLEDDFVLVLDRETGRTVQRIEVGGPQANASFLPDGTTAYVTVTGRNEVVAIDMVELAVVARIAAGEEPMGLVVFDPTAP